MENFLKKWEIKYRVKYENQILPVLVIFDSFGVLILGRIHDFGISCASGRGLCDIDILFEVTLSRVKNWEEPSKQKHTDNFVFFSFAL